MMLIDEATHVRSGCVLDVWRLQALGGRILDEGEEVRGLTLDEHGHDLAPVTRLRWRWTLVALGGQSRILIVQAMP